MSLALKRLFPNSRKSLPTVLKRFFPNGVCRLPRGGFRIFPATTFPARHPVIFATLFSCAKTATADFMVQTYVEKAEKINWHRVGGFALFGLGYLGLVQYGLYVVLMTRVIFSRSSRFFNKTLRERVSSPRFLASNAAQTILDSFVIVPVLYYPAFYLSKEWVMTEGAEGWSSTALQRLQNNRTTDMVAYLKVWAPTTFFCFTFCQPYFRVPFIATVGFGWIVYLSFLRGSEGS